MDIYLTEYNGFHSGVKWRDVDSVMEPIYKGFVISLPNHSIPKPS
jgi:hypothetical protein